MPTPKGMLKKGERIRHIETGRTFVVTRRNGNDPKNYTIWMRPVGKPNALETFMEMPFWIEGEFWEVVEK